MASAYISSLTCSDVVQARQRIEPYIHRTPVLTSSRLNDDVGYQIHFKCENFQRSGSFKMRGATNALLQLTQAEREAGVMTHSSGNHGAALALVGSLLDVPVWVVVPENAPSFKRRAIERYGAKLVDCGPTTKDREATLQQVGLKTGATFVPSSNDERIVAGQGTAALDLVEAVPELDEVWVPVGGGGLASGSVVALEGRSVRVHGAQPELADDAYRSLVTKALQPALPPTTIADGLRTSLGPLTFGILDSHGLEIHLVSETAIAAAQKLIFDYLKIVVEPSSAVPLAALMERKHQHGGSVAHIGVVLTGGNLEFPK